MIEEMIDMPQFEAFCVALRHAAADANAAIAAFDAAEAAGRLEGLDALRVGANAAIAAHAALEAERPEWLAVFKFAGKRAWASRREGAEMDILDLAASLKPDRQGVRVTRKNGKGSRPMPLYRGWKALAFGMASGFEREEHGKLLELFGEKRKLPYWTAMREIAALTTGGGWVGFLVDASEADRVRAAEWAATRTAALDAKLDRVEFEFAQECREAMDTPSLRFWSDFHAQRRIKELTEEARSKAPASKADLAALRGMFRRP